MKTCIEHLATFERCAEGATQYGGTLSLAAIKRLKSPEIKILLIPYREMPPAMAGLMGQEAAGPESLIMFAAPIASAPPPRKKPGTAKATD